jgi:hypothetical protein
LNSSQSAFAIAKKPPGHGDKKTRDNDGKGNGNGNTITLQKCKQAATQSGFDNNQGQECENVIYTHPGENATCSQEGAAAATPTPATGTLLVKKVVVCAISFSDCDNAKFNIKVTDTNPVPSEFVLGNGGTQLVTLGAGSTYTVSEPEHSGFTVKFSGDCPTGTIAPGDHKTCTITNTLLDEG